MNDYSVEMTNTETLDVKTISFETEEERDAFIEKLPPHIESWTFENGTLFRKCLNWEMALG